MVKAHNLKTALFTTLAGLIDKTIDAQTANAISKTAQTILNAAKVDIELSKCSNRNPGNWLGEVTINGDSGDAPPRKGITHPSPGVTAHKLL